MSQSYLPIRELNPSRRKFTIKARCSNRSAVEEKMTKTGNPFKFFHADFVDADAGEIRAKFMFEPAEKFNPMIEKGMVYVITGSSVQVADKRFNTLSNPYELQIRKDDVIELSEEDAAIATEVFNFKTINDIKARGVTQGDFVIDLTAIVKSSEAPRDIQTKTGTSTSVRKYVVFDDCEAAIDVNFWGEAAQTDFPAGTVLAIKSAAVRTYNGARSVTINKGTSVDVVASPATHSAPRVKALAAWWAKYVATSGNDNAADVPFNNISEARILTAMSGAGAVAKVLPLNTVEQFLAKSNDLYGSELYEAEVMVRVRRLMLNDFTASKDNNSDNKRNSFGGATQEDEDAPQSQTVNQTQRNSAISYMACGSCKRKVTLNPGDTQGRCEKCAKNVTPTPNFMFRLSLADHSGSIYPTVFASHAKHFWNCTATTAVEKEKEGNGALRELFDPMVDVPMKLAIKGRKEEYTDREGKAASRIKVDLSLCSKHTEASYGKALIEMLYANVPAVKEALNGSNGLKRSTISGRPSLAAKAEDEFGSPTKSMKVEA